MTATVVLDWRTHGRVGVPVTLVTLALCAGYIGWRLARLSHDRWLAIRGHKHRIITIGQRLLCLVYAVLEEQQCYRDSEIDY